MAISRKSKLRRRLALEKEIPRLKGTGYELTSDPTGAYNCIAWAAGDTSKRWEDDAGGQFYWPHDSRNGTIESLIDAFSAIGYELGGSGKVEEGYEQIALYAVPDEFDARTTWGHAAKLLHDGRWSSKCGHLDDIAHRRMGDVYCEDYGEFYCFMRRKTVKVAAKDEAEESRAAQQQDRPAI